MSDKLPLPKVGEIIYIGTALYLTHGQDDIIGGMATVSDINTANRTVSVEENPGTEYYWDHLGPKQTELEVKFGNTIAHAEPDMRLQFNCPD